MTLWGKMLTNPVGLAAGFDKNGEAVDNLLGLGFGLVEVGSVTPTHEFGNPRPWIYGLLDPRSLIKRHGCDAHGLDEVERRLLHRRRWRAAYRGTLDHAGWGQMLGLSLGVDKGCQDVAADYEAGVRAIGRFADYLVVKLPSPSTPGQRAPQARPRARESKLEGCAGCRPGFQPTARPGNPQGRRELEALFGSSCEF